MTKALPVALLTMTLAGGLTLPTQPPAQREMPPVHLPAETSEAECDVNAPQLLEPPPRAIAEIGFDLAWDHTRGEGVSVAVVDSGIADGNEHFPSDAVGSGTNVVVKDDPAAEDFDGQGTAIAGIIGARDVDGSGVIGAAPETTLIPIRVGYGDTGSSDADEQQVTAKRIATGIRAAADAGAQIITVTVATSEDAASLQDAVRYATAEGALIVASAGTARDAQREDDERADDAPAEPVQEWYPAAYPDALAVAPVTSQNGAAENASAGSWIDIAAPGEEVPTTFVDAGDCVLGGDDPDAALAAGYVGAAGALVAAKFPDAGPEDWAYRLLATASGAVTNTYQETVGWGVIQPQAALSLFVDGTAAGPDAPGLPAADPSPPRAPQVDLSHHEDPAAAARSATAWWALGGAATVMLLLLLVQVPWRRRKRRS